MRDNENVPVGHSLRSPPWAKQHQPVRCHLPTQPSTHPPTHTEPSESPLAPLAVTGGDLPHLILEELPERLNELKLQVLGQAAHIVVALDGVAVLLATAWGRAALNDIRVQRALQEAGFSRFQQVSAGYGFFKVQCAKHAPDITVGQPPKRQSPELSSSGPCNGQHRRLPGVELQQRVMDEQLGTPGKHPMTTMADVGRRQLPGRDWPQHWQHWHQQLLFNNHGAPCPAASASLTL